MKKIFLKSMLFVLAFLLIITSLSLGETQKYTNKEFGFSIILPEGWEVQDGKPYNITAIFLGPVDGGFRINFNLNIVNIPEEGATIDEELISVIKEELTKSLEMLGEVNFLSEGKRKVSNFDSYEIVYILKVGKMEIKQKQVYFINKDKFYVFTFSALKENFDKYIQTFEQIINTFETI
jgi:hypothetical protein